MSNLCVPKLIKPSSQNNRNRRLNLEPLAPHSERPLLGAQLTTVTPKCCFVETNKHLIKMTQVQRQVRLISYRPQRKTIFGDKDYPYFTPRMKIGGSKVEGQLGGSLAKPNNF
jgi:hypothetical protein